MLNALCKEAMNAAYQIVFLFLFALTCFTVSFKFFSAALFRLCDILATTKIQGRAPNTTKACTLFEVANEKLDDESTTKVKCSAEVSFVTIAPFNTLR